MSALRIADTHIFVRGLRVQAEVGVYEHEHGRTQPLVLDIELRLSAGGFEHIADTINYEHIQAWAQGVAASGHIKLVEHFAERVAQACLADPRVLSARIRVEKPQALAPALAGVDILFERAS